MFNSKNNFLFLIFLEFLFTFNNNNIIAMNNDFLYNNIPNQLIELNKQLDQELEEQQEILTKIKDTNLHDFIMTEEFNQKIIFNSNKIDDLTKKIYILSENQIIDEKMSKFINQQNELVFNLIINSNGNVDYRNITQLTTINRQINLLTKKRNRLNHFISTNFPLFNNDNKASTSGL
ncbi:MAG: hypothetical protein Q8831_02170 ['Bonamia sp.' little leaf phytoplasma]|nr:hypothetical protein ['Bonamia sp.' little leaf phytoplasma]